MVVTEDCRSNILFAIPICDIHSTCPFYDEAQPEESRGGKTVRWNLNTATPSTAKQARPDTMACKIPCLGCARSHASSSSDGPCHDVQGWPEKPVYNGNAYTYTATYHGGTGTLRLFAHHITAPATPEGRPEYHMNQLRIFGMTGIHATFAEGATAYKNLRDLAKQHRDMFIQDANARYQAEVRLIS
ncbi:hypothetical protein M406DRAFT_71434 [Cryphonectria parasitica EP155]|uniref:Uncharacterized protein n=1 Tax=Cryphonectria parasitica (strain ATCC 38755 / EP155) TaxID=660469 RepID=A0A9P4Y7Z8_CRYP1|nr:uncharacterized protein M406DRAFT_71434 [Cryphonectria parasitica EP155]KAF3768421.1 hypothetical protein M406DRAFT_71434 [Cryphonectria parasitica EP155]